MSSINQPNRPFLMSTNFIYCKSIHRYILCLIVLGLVFSATAQFPKNKLNVIVFTADDLGGDALGVGAFGGKMKNITPTIDSIAKQSLRFYNMHVNSAICVPSRGVFATGLYGFNSKQHGFFYTPDSIPTIMESFQKKGYKAGILGKVKHSTVKQTTQWDYQFDEKDLGVGKSPSKYYERTKAFIQQCKASNSPFYFMINSHDPHRPFQDNTTLLPGSEWPSKMFTPEEAYVPGFLSDLPEVRTELSHYYNSVRRLDDTFAAVMKALKESGEANNTLLIFFSDNGIAMPFAKGNCYLSSTRTPFFIYMPGTVKPGENRTMLSTVDVFPTIMDMVGGEKPARQDGNSFLPLIEGKKQSRKDQVFTEINYLNGANGGKYYPMRGVLDKKYAYIFNPWSDQTKEYFNANEGKTFKAMIAKAPTDEKIATRVKMFRYRAVEELYDLQKDPDCLNNLANTPAYKKVKQQYRTAMQQWMQDKGDPMLAILPLIDKPEEMKLLLNSIYTTILKTGVSIKDE